MGGYEFADKRHFAMCRSLAFCQGKEEERKKDEVIDEMMCEVDDQIIYEELVQL